MDSRLQPQQSMAVIPSRQHTHSSMMSSRSSTSRRDTMPEAQVGGMERIIISDDDDAPPGQNLRKQPRIPNRSRILHPPIPATTMKVVNQIQRSHLSFNPCKTEPSTHGGEADPKVKLRMHPRSNATHPKGTAAAPIDICSISASSTSSPESRNLRPQPSQIPRHTGVRSSGFGAHAKKHKASMINMVRTRESSSLKKGYPETQNAIPFVILPLQRSIEIEAAQPVFLPSTALYSSATPKKQRSTTGDSAAYRSKSKVENVPARSFGQSPRPRPRPGSYTLPTMDTPLEQWTAKIVDHSRTKAHSTQYRKTPPEEMYSASSSLNHFSEDLDAQQPTCFANAEAELPVVPRGHEERGEDDEMREMVAMTAKAEPDLVSS